MLGGNISRAPDFKLDYFQRIPYFQALTETEFGRPITPELRAAAAAQAGELAYLYDTEFVVLTPPIADRLPYSDTWQASWDFVKTTWPLAEQPFYAQDGIEAYRVRQPEGSDSFRLDLGEPGTFPYRGEGWDAAETDTPYDTGAIWATALQSRLFVPLRQVDPAATYAVRLRVHPFAYPGSRPQTVALAANGVQAGAPQALRDGWQEIAWQVRGSALLDGLNRLDLQWGDTAAPRTVTPGSRQIGSTGVELPIDADVKAFADGGFMALFDAAGEQIDASAGRRGVNVTVLDPKSGQVLGKEGFDTTANAGESAKLAAYLQQNPRGVTGAGRLLRRRLGAPHARRRDRPPRHRRRRQLRWIAEPILCHHRRRRRPARQRRADHRPRRRLHPRQPHPRPSHASRRCGLGGD